MTKNKVNSTLFHGESHQLQLTSDDPPKASFIFHGGIMSRIHGACFFAFLLLNSFLPEVSRASPRAQVELKANSVIQSLKEGRFEADTQAVLNELVKRAVSSLREHGHPTEAGAYELEWSRNYSDLLLRTADRDQRDHRSLNQWLSRFHGDLEQKIGKFSCRITRLHDLKVLSESIPVVFHPEGQAGEQPEYLHRFVPFAGTVTFWSTNLSCRAALALPVSIGCDPASEVAQFFVENWIAPDLVTAIQRQARH
jgi:hypothetical protein